MREIPLSQGKVALVDDEDFERVSQFKWHAYKDHNSFYAQAHDTPRSTVYMHRVVMAAQKGEKIDHIDGDGLNNRRSNLRRVTHQQNMQNSRSVVGQSRFKGVSRSASGKWRARISLDRKEVNLGSFFSETIAACEYDRKARELFGEFACTNFAPEFADAYYIDMVEHI